MKKQILSIIALLALPFAAHSATIAVGAGFGATSGVIAQLADGTVLSGGGYYIGVGVYDSTPVINSPADLQAAVAAFTEFGSATSATTGATQGKITASITAIPAAPATFNTKEMYMVIGNAASKAESTQFAILQGTPTWNFPADTAAGGATTFTVSSIASFAPIAGAGSEIDAATDGIRLAVVPEPSATVLLALGALALARRRR